LREIAQNEREILLRVKKRIENEIPGAKVPEISVGSTPTVCASEEYDGITEIRPGIVITYSYEYENNVDIVTF
jgi:D-serine deaminase-like pyridoxal phosphate-dependent protein